MCATTTVIIIIIIIIIINMFRIIQILLRSTNVQVYCPLPSGFQVPPVVEVI